MNQITPQNLAILSWFSNCLHKQLRPSLKHILSGENIWDWEYLSHTLILKVLILIIIKDLLPRKDIVLYIQVQ